MWIDLVHQYNAKTGLDKYDASGKVCNYALPYTRNFA